MEDRKCLSGLKRCLGDTDFSNMIQVEKHGSYMNKARVTTYKDKKSTNIVNLGL